MRTKLLKKLRKEANKQFEVIECTHCRFRLTGVMFYGAPLDWYSPRMFGEEMVLASNRSQLPRVNPFVVVNKWWIKQIKQRKRDYILMRVEKMRLHKHGISHIDAAREIVSILNERANI